MESRLLPCLLAQKWYLLRAITRAIGVPFDSNLSVAEAAERLHARLLDPGVLDNQWRTLSQEGRSAWFALLEAGGAMRREDFIRRFGALPPYTPWRSDAPQSPWQDPQSPAEEILYRGLAFEVNRGTARHPVWTIVLPDEYRESLASLASLAASASPLSTRHSIPSSPPIVADAFAFLSLLNRHEVRATWGRWLPPTALRELSRHLSRQMDLAAVRSERDVLDIAPVRRAPSTPCPASSCAPSRSKGRRRPGC